MSGGDSQERKRARDRVYQANKRGGYKIGPRNTGHDRQRHNARVIVPIRDGCVFVVSDQHFDPGVPPSAAYLASVKLARELEPWCIINNGDTIDGASISRWPVGSFTELGSRPSVEEELGVSSKRLIEYERMKFAQFLIWNLGNHDARFETRLAEKVPEYAGVNGFRLKDHFPGWLPAWRTDFVRPDNSVELIVKHRFKGGMYAANNNALWAGTSIITGHLHDLYIKAITDVRGVRWGASAGTLAECNARLATHYTEDNPVNWQSGFLVVTFAGGLLSGIEPVYALPDGRVLFRGMDIAA